MHSGQSTLQRSPNDRKFYHTLCRLIYWSLALICPILLYNTFYQPHWYHIAPNFYALCNLQKIMCAQPVEKRRKWRIKHPGTEKKLMNFYLDWSPLTIANQSVCVCVWVRNVQEFGFTVRSGIIRVRTHEYVLLPCTCTMLHRLIFIVNIKPVY